MLELVMGEFSVVVSAEALEVVDFHSDASRRPIRTAPLSSASESQFGVKGKLLRLYKPM